MTKTSFTIKKGVNIPEEGNGGFIAGKKNKVNKFKYPFKDMNIGDSFQFRLEDLNRVAVNAFIAFGKGNFKVRKMNQTFGRVWRVG